MDFLMSIIKTVGGKGWMEIGSVSYIFGWISDHANFFIPLTVLITAQLTKFVIHSMENGWNWKNITMYGHMPSAHTATAISVTISAALFDPNHLRSGAFVVGFFWTFFLIDDAAHLRMHISDQGKYLNAFAQKLNTFAQRLGMKEEKFPHLEERLGHRLNEVIWGAILGFILSLVLAWILW